MKFYTVIPRSDCTAHSLDELNLKGKNVFALDLSLLKCFHIWQWLAMSKNTLCFRQELISLDSNLIEVGTKAKIMKMSTDFM